MLLARLTELFGEETIKELGSEDWKVRGCRGYRREAGEVVKEQGSEDWKAIGEMGIQKVQGGGGER